MNSPPAARADALGAQRPRVATYPKVRASAANDAIELCEMARLELDPWQEFILRHSLGERPDGKWAAFEVAAVAPRQNGKNTVLEARQLIGLFLLEERLQVHSAHLFDTSLEAFRRLLALIEDTPDFDSRVRRVSRSHGEEGIELKTGQRIRFRTRTKGGGRGFTADCLYFDEAMFLPEAAHGSILPTLSARPNPQVWYTGSAVDQWVHDNGVVLTRVRNRGHEGDSRLAYFEWGLEDGNPDWVGEEISTDEAKWAQANPALGIRITAEHVAAEHRSLDPRTFAVERLGVGDWPAVDADADALIPPRDWQALTDADSKPLDPVTFAVDVTPDRKIASIGVAGRREDGLVHVEVVEREAGTGWVAPRLAELVRRHAPRETLLDDRGPGASLLPQLEEHGVEVRTVGAAEHGRACGSFFDLVSDEGLRHLGTAELSAAIRGALTRPLGDAWAWSRKTSTIDISPLVAVTLAAWGVVDAPDRVDPATFHIERL